MTNWIPDIADRSGPRYRAIADALAADIESGVLPPQTQLPTHRELAYRLGVTVGTVTRAYSEAERRGLIGGEVGRGTFVRPASYRDPPVRGDIAPGEWLATGEGGIDMSKCIPPVPEVEQALSDAIANLLASGRLAHLLGYGTEKGTDRHRAAGAEWLVRQHRVKATPDCLLLSIGAQNAILAALASLARPGDVVACECLTYHGIKAAARTLGMDLEGIAMDEEGVLPEALEEICRRRNIRVLYINPTIHNPTGTVLPIKRRIAIAEICRRHGVSILEDDVFGFLALDGPPPLQTMAPDLTIYVTSVSKSIAAGLRLGYMAVPRDLVPRVEGTLRSLFYSSPPLMAELASQWILDGDADRFAARQRDEAKARQADAKAILPTGSFLGHRCAQHLWFTLPEPWRREEFVTAARERGVAVINGSVFAVGRIAAPHAVRIGLCMPRSRDEAARGLRILADLTASHAGVSFPIV